MLYINAQLMLTSFLDVLNDDFLWEDIRCKNKWFYAHIVSYRKNLDVKRKKK